MKKALLYIALLSLLAYSCSRSSSITRVVVRVFVEDTPAWAGQVSGFQSMVYDYDDVGCYNIDAKKGSVIKVMSKDGKEVRFTIPKDAPERVFVVVRLDEGTADFVDVNVRPCGYLENGLRWYSLERQDGLHAAAVDRNIILPFSMGLDRAYLRGIGFIAEKDHKWAIFDTKGQNIIPFEKYDSLNADFCYKGVRVFRDGKNGICNDKGQEIVPVSKYDLVFPLNKELTRFRIVNGGKEGLCNASGKELIPLTKGYDNLFYHDGYIRVKKSGKRGIYGINGNEIIPTSRGYDSIVDGDGFFIVSRDGRQGACRMGSGEEIVAPKHDGELQCVNNEFVYTLSDGSTYHTGIHNRIARKPVTVNKEVHTGKAEQASVIQDDAEQTFKKGLEAYNSGDFQEAIKHFMASSSGGYAMASYYLGWCYHTGEGVGKDEVQMLHWLKKAADSGIISAQKDVGYCYMNGTGTSVNHNESLRYFTKAAEAGNPEAQYAVAYHYIKGLGTAKDIKRSIAWLEKSAAGGYEPAAQQLKDIKAVVNKQNPDPFTTLLSSVMSGGSVVNTMSSSAFDAAYQSMMSSASRQAVSMMNQYQNMCNDIINTVPPEAWAFSSGGGYDIAGSPAGATYPSSSANQGQMLGTISAFGIGKSGFGGDTYTVNQAFQVYRDGSGYYILGAYGVHDYLRPNGNSTYLGIGVSQYNYVAGTGPLWFFRL